MTDVEPYDYAAARRAASELALRERIAARLDWFYAQRPPVFAKQGDLLPDVAEWGKRFVAGERTGLILVGNVGVGKTWTLWKIKESLIKAGWLGAVEIRAAHELKQITTPPVDDAALRLLAEAGLLALDDVGSIRVSDWDADKLLALVDERWKFQRPTVLTSNNPKLRELLGEIAASRLADGATTVKMTGTDRRRSQ